MEWELEQATSEGVPIIAVKPFVNTNISMLAFRYASDTVNWNNESIVAAIRKYARD